MYSAAGLTWPGSVEIADVDGDGHADLLVGGLLNDVRSLMVIFNNGDGTFAAPVGWTLTNGVRSHTLTLGDLDADGDLDVVFATGPDYGVTVMLNDGSGGFPTETFHPLVSRAGSVSLGDVDADGDLDLAVKHWNPPADAENVVLLLNNGDGTFAAPQLIFELEHYHLHCLATVDVNQDGADDLVLVDDGSSTWYSGILILLSYGDGTFGDPAQYGQHHHGAKRVRGADMDGDGDPDLVVVGLSRTVHVYLNDGYGAFPDLLEYGTGWLPLDVVVGDLDGDGALDLAVANGGASNTIAVLLSRACEETVWGDLDLDFDVDLDDFWLFAPCLGGPDVTTPPPGCDPLTFARADLDGDGDVDLADFADFQVFFTGDLAEGACCFGDGTCMDLTASDCTDFGGTYLGNGTSCATENCQGACCFPGGFCLDLNEDNCTAAAGSFQGFDTDCATTSCP